MHMGGTSGIPKHDYMGVAVAFPSQVFLLEEAKIQKVADVLETIPHSEDQKDEAFNLSRGRRNQMISLRLRRRPGDSCVATPRTSRHRRATACASSLERRLGRTMEHLPEKTLEELEERHEREVQEMEERGRKHMEEVTEKAGKGKKAKQLIEAAHREVEQWMYELQEKQKEEVEELTELLSPKEKENEREKVEESKDHDANPEDEEEKGRRKKEKAQKKRQAKADKEAQREAEKEREKLEAGPSAREIELEALQSVLTQQKPPLKVHEIPSDGHSAEYQLRRVRPELLDEPRPDDMYKEVRRICAKSLKSDVENYAPFAELKDSQDFGSFEWPNHLEVPLEMFSELLEPIQMVMTCDDWPQVMVIHASICAKCAFEFAGDLPLVLAGDFNFRPGSAPYELLTTGKLKEDHEHRPVDVEAGSHNLDCQAFDEEPFVGTLDYIFVSKQTEVVSVERLPSSVTQGGHLPTEKEPSDHLLISATVLPFGTMDEPLSPLGPQPLWSQQPKGIMPVSPSASLRRPKQREDSFQGRALCTCGHGPGSHDAKAFHGCQVSGCLCQTFHHAGVCSCRHGWACHRTELQKAGASPYAGTSAPSSFRKKKTFCPWRRHVDPHDSPSPSSSSSSTSDAETKPSPPKPRRSTPPSSTVRAPSGREGVSAPSTPTGRGNPTRCGQSASADRFFPATARSESQRSSGSRPPVQPKSTEKEKERLDVRGQPIGRCPSVPTPARGVGRVRRCETLRVARRNTVRWKTEPGRSVKRGFYRPMAGASKMKWQFTLPYVREVDSLHHYPAVSEVTGKAIDWYADEPQDGHLARALGVWQVEG
eukprot:g24136.t1